MNNSICNFCKTKFSRTQELLIIKDNFTIVQCPVCKLVFRDPAPTSEELKNIYSDEYFFSDKGDTNGQGYQNYTLEEQNIRYTARRRLARINTYLKDVGTLLDVGCASGYFLDEARQMGWSVAGIEFSSTMANIAKTQLRLHVTTGQFQEYKPSNTFFDCITMWDYLEHSVDPSGDIATSYNLLKTDGILAISTGDFSSLMARLSGKRWHLLTPRHHLYFFSKQVLKKYIEKQGFTILRIQYTADYYSFAYLLYKLYTIFPVDLFKRLANSITKHRCGSFRVPITFFDIMTIYAKKTNS